MDNREVTYSYSRDYMGRSVKFLAASLALRTKIKNKKQKERISISEITNQYFRKFFMEFNNSPYLGYKNKQVHNEPT